MDTVVQNALLKKAAGRLMGSVSSPSHLTESLTMNAQFIGVQNQISDGVQQRWMKMELILGGREIMDTVVQNALLKKAAGPLTGRSVSFPSKGRTLHTMHALFMEVENQRGKCVQQRWMKMEGKFGEIMDTVAQNALLKKAAGQLGARSVSSPSH